MLCFLIPYSVLLKKGKSIREVMKEKGVLEDYLKNHKLDPAKKYIFNEYYVAYEPMAYMDVSLPSFLS